MTFTPQLIGKATGTNVTSLSISTPSVPAGGRIFCAICINKDGFDSLTDTAGNVYEQAAGSQSGVGAFVFQATNNLHLANNDQITLAFATPFSASIGAFAVSGLTSGVINISSAGQGNDRFPGAAIDNVPANDWCVGILAVNGPSSDGFTQDPTFSNPGNFNTQVTTGFSAYGGYRQSTGGKIVYQPILGIARIWSCMLVDMSP